jgi:glycosyltransferase involved in cell wall biosynthesis
MILYIGSYFSEDIVKARGIPYRNAAGSNRILRIANSLSINHKNVEIISPGISLRSKPISKQDCQSKLEKIDNITVFYAKTSLIPIINLIVPIFSIIKRVYSYSQKKNISAVIIYNFSIELFIIAMFIKIFTSTKIINDVEDISIPKLIDWRLKTESRVFQQLIFYVCMKLIAYLSDCFIVPSVKFTKYLPTRRKPVAVISGCSKVKNYPSFDCSYPLNILLSGKIEIEHGIGFLLDSLTKMDITLSNKINIVICGDGAKAHWLQKVLTAKKLDFVFYHGFLTDNKYENLLMEADICLVLQNPNGRYKELKTPSKFYEYYSSGKCVIASKVGDYDQLPENSFLSLDPYTPDKLLMLLTYCVENVNQVKKIKNSAYNFAIENFSYENVGSELINVLNLRI